MHARDSEDKLPTIPFAERPPPWSRNTLFVWLPSLHEFICVYIYLEHSFK